jgi:hypothetical protein
MSGIKSVELELGSSNVAIAFLTYLNNNLAFLFCASSPLINPRPSPRALVCTNPSNMPTFNQFSHRLSSAAPFLSRVFRVRPSRLPLIGLAFIAFYTIYSFTLSDAESSVLPTWLGGKQQIIDEHLLNFDMYPDITRNGRKHAHIEDDLAAHVKNPGRQSGKGKGRDEVVDEDIEDEESGAGLMGNLANWFGSSTTSTTKKAAQVAWELDPVAEAHHQVGTLEFSPRDGLVRGWKLDKLKSKPGKKTPATPGLQSGTRTTHPIEILMAENGKRWQHFLERQSSTLQEAFEEYVHRYKRLPPKGFDKWWEFCVKNDVKIRDDYDQINHDIEPYLALSPELFRQRVKDLDGTQFT